MTVDTGAFLALTAEVRQLAEQVRGMAAREGALEAAFEAGRSACQDDIRRSMGMPVKSRGERPRAGAASRGHLQAVPGGLR